MCTCVCACVCVFTCVCVRTRTCLHFNEVERRSNAQSESQEYVCAYACVQVCVHALGRACVNQCVCLCAQCTCVHVDQTVFLGARSARACVRVNKGVFLCARSARARGAHAGVCACTPTDLSKDHRMRYDVVRESLDETVVSLDETKLNAKV